MFINFPRTKHLSIAIKRNTREMSNCIFCKIICGELPSEILYHDDDLQVFKDIKPAAKHHYLVIPKKHIANVNALTFEDKDLLNKLVERGKEVLKDNGGDLNDLTTGFHMPPFNTVSHLHLHVISPSSSMGLLHRIAFKPNTWWFSSAAQISDKLENGSKL